jgi:hypothetical protein
MIIGTANNPVGVGAAHHNYRHCFDIIKYLSFLIFEEANNGNF